MNGRLRTGPPPVRAPRRSSSLHPTAAEALEADQSQTSANVDRTRRPFPLHEPIGIQNKDDAPYPPESSAQGAARSPELPTRLPSGGSQFRRTSSPYQPPSAAAGGVSTEPPAASVHGTFGRSDQAGLALEADATFTSRPVLPQRQASPTERRAFGYLNAEWLESRRDQQAEIQHYLDTGQRKERIDALEREMNLPSSPISPEGQAEEEEGEEEEEEELRERSVEASVRSARSVPQSVGRVEGPCRQQSQSRTSLQTFGFLPHDEHSQHNSGSNHAPSGDASGKDLAASRSETAESSRLSRDTRTSDTGYGVGEMGGDEDFGPLARTLTQEQVQERERNALLQMRHGGNGLDEGVGAAVAVSPQDRRGRRLSSPDVMLNPQRTSQTSASTVQGPSQAFRVSDPSAFASESRSRDDPASRRMRGQSSTNATPHLDEAQLHDPTLATGSVTDGHRGGARKLVFMPHAAGPTKSASVSVRTPVFGQPPDGLPAGQRASYYSSAEMQNPGPSWTAIASGHRRALSSASRPSGASGRPRFESVVHEQGYSSFSLDLPSRSGSMSANRALQQRAKGRYHFFQLYSTRPRFPAKPYSSWPDLACRSRWARLHHLVLPVLTLAHIPLTIFLDFNAVFVLVQVAVHPDADQAGVRAAWWVATGIYGACSVLWLVGVVVLYEVLGQWARRWSVERPLILPIYLSAPAQTYTAIRSYTLFSLLRSARTTALRQDFAVETFWHYSQNWPTMLTLLPRAALCVVLAVLYRRDGPALTLDGQRDVSFFESGTGRLTVYAFVVLLINAAWAAWRLAILALSWAALLALLGWRSAFERQKDGYSFGMMEFEKNREGSRRHLFQQSDLDEGTGRELQSALALEPSAWKLRAEDRIRALLFDAGADGLTEQQGANEDQTLPDSERVRASPWPDVYREEAQQATLTQMAHEPRSETRFAQQMGDASVTTPFPAPAIVLPTADASGSVDGDQASDHYSPVPTPIGRSPRSKEQLRTDSLSRRDLDGDLLPFAAASSLPTSQFVPVVTRGNRQQQHPGLHEAATAGDPIAAPPAFEPVSLATSTEPSPDESSAGDSPILGGRRRITSMQSSDLYSTNVAMSTSSSPVALRQPLSRGRKRARSSPSVEMHADPSGSRAASNPAQVGIQASSAPQNDDIPMYRAEIPFPPAAFGRDAESVVLRRGRSKSSGDEAKVQSKEKEADFGSNNSSPNFEVGSSSDTKHSGPQSVLGLDTFAGQSEQASKRVQVQGPRTPPSADVAAAREGTSAKASPRLSLSSLLPFVGSRNNSRPTLAGDAGASSEELQRTNESESARVGRDSWLSASSGKDGTLPSRLGGGADAWWSSFFGANLGSLSRKQDNDSNEQVQAADKGSPRTPQGSNLSVSNADDAVAEPDRCFDAHGDRNAGQAQPVSVTQDVGSLVRGGDPPHDGAPGASGSGMRLVSAARSSSPSTGRASHETNGTEDSEEERLWASFPEQTRIHPPGLIALSLEQQIAEARIAAVATSGTAVSSPVDAMRQVGMQPLIGQTTAASGVSLSSSYNDMSMSPSLGGLHAIREESWSSSLESAGPPSEGQEEVESRQDGEEAERVGE